MQMQQITTKENCQAVREECQEQTEMFFIETNIGAQTKM